MRSKRLGTVTLVMMLGLGLPGAAEAKPATNAQVALSENASESATAIAALRSQGSSGLQTFLNTYREELSGNPSQVMTPRWQRLSATLDAICQQRDCYASRLYWYTDLEQAKAAAKASGKPILSLRLLGRLDEDLSCANSRFFRIALYPNADVSQALRDRFILHWQSVRPVPKVTIDFGDGRKLQQTITGNSIHYILDAEGKPIDALPGLYGPQAFLKQVLQAEKAVKEYSQQAPQAKETFLRAYHRDRLAAIERNWTGDLSNLGISLPLPSQRENQSTSSAPTAAQAAPIAMSKMAVETPLLRSISRDRLLENRQALETATSNSLWGKIGQLHSGDAQLDLNSQALMRRKNPHAYAGLQQKSGDNPLEQVLSNFERLMAVDTIRNEYLLHSQIHEWFIQGASTTTNVDTLNERVYAQLFLTPSTDPWLGLLPRDAYTAIENDGISPGK